MATQRKTRDMIRWNRLSEDQQFQLDRLFAGCPEHQKVLHALKQSDGDAMPLIVLAKQLWDEVGAKWQENVQAFREGFEYAKGFTSTGEQRQRDNEDPARAYLYVWYDQMYVKPRPLLAIKEGDYAPYPEEMVLLNVIKIPLQLPNVSEVDAKARALVIKSLKSKKAKKRRRYARKRIYQGENRYNEQLVNDLMAEFKAKRRLIRLRLDDAVFSLEREFPDLVYKV